MKIEHTTYDQTHGGRSTRRPSAPSASQNMTGSSTSRPRHSEKKFLSADDERPVTIWPRTDTSRPKPLPEITIFLILEQRPQKEVREKERATARVHFSDARSPKIKSTTRKHSSQPNQAPPPLRRKPNFSETVRECLGSLKSTNEKNDTIPEMDEMTKVHILRDRIREGKLEKTVPPAHVSGTEVRLAPPRSRNPALKPPSPEASGNKKPSPTRTKFTEFIDKGADVLDETRKDLAGTFLPPFENLNYPSFSRSGKKLRRNSDVSDTSFCCIGETESAKDVEAPTKEIQALKKQQQHNATRLSGEGTNPWSQPPAATCRLCRKPGVRSIRGLCNECETDFIRPKTNQYEFLLPSNEEDGIKPTPPLKDLEILIVKTSKMTKEVGAKSKSISHPNLDKKESHKRNGSVGTELKMTDTGNYPQIIIPTQRQKSHEAIIDGESGDEKYKSWQTPEMRAEYERSKSLFKRWSDCYEADDFEGFGKKDSSAPHVGQEGARLETGESRCSEFYGFYDELLREHGAKTDRRAATRGVEY